ncbi:MAG: hypothetical protein WBZ40_04900 [Acidimicrobiia bacterium]
MTGSISETSGFLKWAGLAALVGGVLTVVLDVGDFVLRGDQPVSVTATAGWWIVLHGGYLLADLLILIALVGIWRGQARQAAALGVAGFLIAFAGTAMLAGLEWSTAFLFPWFAESVPEILDADPSGTALAGYIVTVLLAIVGWILFGVASLRARVYPRGPVWLLILGTVILLALGSADAPFLDTVWGLGLAWLGYEIWSVARKTRQVTAGV